MVLLESLARRRPVIIFNEIKHIIGDKKGVFVSKRNFLSFLGILNHIKKNYKKIQKDMKKNKLPTNKEFIERFISKNNLKFEVYDEMVKKIKLNGRFRSLVRSKLKYNKDNFYILLTPWPNYIRFLKKIPKTNFIDVKYII